MPQAETVVWPPEQDLSTTGAMFESAFEYLGPYRPVLARTGVLRDGQAVLHVWLIVLKAFARGAA